VVSVPPRKLVVKHGRVVVADGRCMRDPDRAELP
jgi:hypothetical protein